MADEIEMGGKDARAERLAAALRANLRRRKSQARARSAGNDEHAGEGPEQGDASGEGNA